uniref:14-3-3 domain-containing protein n=1 Tax=Globisporangium ultimum (strain ATCC 200006 / CBS 805.95 / DAOM BR144) TaxID=431595 RepID=K3W6D4_GLOUD
MAHFMMLAATTYNDEFVCEERKLLSTAYQNVITTLCASYRAVETTAVKPERSAHERRLVTKYRTRIQDELVAICNELLMVVDKHLLPSSSETEAKVFYYKMKADFYRYLVEMQVDITRRHSATSALEAYKQAFTLAIAELPSTHPLRLDLALNFAVFYFEILNSTDRASSLADLAVDDTVGGQRRLSDPAYRDSTLIMQLLRDNAILWKADQAPDTIKKAATASNWWKSQ